MVQIVGQGVNVRWNHMHANVVKSADMSLENLGEGIEYIDLLLLHCTEVLSERTHRFRADCVQARETWSCCQGRE